MFVLFTLIRIYCKFTRQLSSKSWWIWLVSVFIRGRWASKCPQDHMTDTVCTLHSCLFPLECISSLCGQSHLLCPLSHFLIHAGQAVGSSPVDCLKQAVLQDNWSRNGWVNYANSPLSQISLTGFWQKVRTLLLCFCRHTSLRLRRRQHHQWRNGMYRNPAIGSCIYSKWIWVKKIITTFKNKCVSRLSTSVRRTNPNHL